MPRKKEKQKENSKPHTPQRKQPWAFWSRFFCTGFYYMSSFVYYLLHSTFSSLLNIHWKHDFFFTKIWLWNFPNIHKNEETRVTSPQLTTLSFDSRQFLPVFCHLCPPFLYFIVIFEWMLIWVVWSPSPPKYTRVLIPGPCGCDLIWK